MRRPGTILVSLLLAAALVAGGPSLAQQSEDVAVELLAPAQAAEVPAPVILPLNKAQIIRLPVDVRDALVANPDIADVVVKTPTLVYLLGRQVGDTNVFFFDKDGNEILRLEVRVELDLTPLRMALRELMPDDPIEVTAVNQQVVLTGTVRSARAAEDVRLVARRFVGDDENILNMIRIASDQQVLIRVRVAEMNRDIVKQLGIRWENVVLPERQVEFQLTSGVTLTDPAGAFSTASLVFASGATTFTAIIEALERDGVVKTLAEPSLAAVSGEDASFLAGGEFPLLVPGEEPGTFSIEFRQFGVGLTFTPVVLDSGLISLRVSTEVSALSTQGELTLVTGTGVNATTATIPGLTVRRATTTVELPSGGSLVIAGILQDDIRNTLRGIPGLKDLPVLGPLFRSVEFQREETELVITVTPYLVRPAGERSLALPTDGFAPATDADMYLQGRLHAVYGEPRAVPPARLLQGPFGYIME